MGSTGNRERCPLGSVTSKEAGAAAGESAGTVSMSASARPRGLGGGRRRFQFAYFLELTRTQRLAVRAVPADLRARQQNLKPEVTFDLLPQPLQWFAEKLFHLAAPQADDVRVFLFQLGFVVMLVAAIVHQVQLVNQP